MSWLAKPWVGHFLQTIADHIVSQDSQKNCGTRKYNQPPHLLNRESARFQQRTPARIRWRGSETKVTQAALDENRAGDAESDGDEHRSKRVSQHMQKHDAEPAGSNRS